MKAKEIRDMSLDEMNQKVVELKEAYFNLRFQHATGQLENQKTLLLNRRDIARVKTILREKTLNSKDNA